MSCAAAEARVCEGLAGGGGDGPRRPSFSWAAEARSQAGRICSAFSRGRASCGLPLLPVLLLVALLRSRQPRDAPHPAPAPAPPAPRALPPAAGVGGGGGGKGQGEGEKKKKKTEMHPYFQNNNCQESS